MMKILILHTSEGYGPKVVAQNIGEYLQTNTDWEIRILDTMQAERGTVIKMIQRVYFYIYQRLPFLWGFLYRTKLVHNRFVYRLRYLMALRGRKVRRQILEYHPDIILSTQTFASAIAASAIRRKLWQGRLGIVFSDYHFHRFWVYPEADFFFCVTAVEKQRLLELGVAENKIRQVGVPIHPKFFQTPDKALARSRFGLPSDQPIVTLTGGRRALQASIAVIKELLDLPIHLVVVCGKNTTLQQRIQEFRSTVTSRLTVLGFVENMEELLAATDILISKPGGPTISEAAAIGVPVILADAHPGHEMANYEYLTANQLAVGALAPREVARAVKDLLAEPEAIRGQVARAKQLVNPTALAQIKNFLDNMSN